MLYRFIIYSLLIILSGCATVNDMQIRPTVSIAYLAYTDGFWQVWVMDVNGDYQQQVTTTAFDKVRASWYPDGEHLLVGGRQQGLMKISIKSGRETKINLPWPGITDAAISPDGKQIAFAANVTDGVDIYHIWVANADGSGPRKLTTMPYLQHEPVWSRDGEWVYFLSGKGGQSHDIWRVSVKDKRKEQLTAGQLYHFELALSVEGELAYSSNRSGNYEIWRQKPGEKAVQLTANPLLDSQPAWSPEGNKMLFTSNRKGGRPNIWLMELDTQQTRQLTTHKMGAMSPVWFIPVKGK